MARLCELPFSGFSSSLILQTVFMLIGVFLNMQGIFWAFIIFNFIVIFSLSWLYLNGVQKIKKGLSLRKVKGGAKGKKDGGHGQLQEKSRSVSSSSLNQA